MIKFVLSSATLCLVAGSLGGCYSRVEERQAPVAAAVAPPQTVYVVPAAAPQGVVVVKPTY